MFRFAHPDTGQLSQALAVSDGSAQILKLCSAVMAAAPIHRASGFEAAFPPEPETPSGGLGAIADLTCEALAVGGLESEFQELLLEVTRSVLRVYCVHSWFCPPAALPDVWHAGMASSLDIRCVWLPSQTAAGFNAGFPSARLCGGGGCDGRDSAGAL